MIVLDSMLRKAPGMCGEDAFFRYLPVTEETMSRGMYLTGAGRSWVHPGEKYPASGHPALYQMDWFRGRTLPEYQLILVTNGAGEFDSTATGHVRIEEAAVIFVFPGVWHRFRPLPAVGWTERWFSFNGEAVHRLFDASVFSPRHAVIRPPMPQQLADSFDELLNGVRRGATSHPARTIFQALEVISEAIGPRIDEAIELGAAPRQRFGMHREDPIVQRALEIIWTNSPYPMSVSDIARQLPVTRRTLDRRFVEATGHSVLEEINICRLCRAKRLLSETDLPVKTVAHLAGFSSTERMRVLFIEREGVSPVGYRKRSVRRTTTSQPDNNG